MAVDAPKKSPAELEQEKRDREAREAAQRAPILPAGGVFSQSPMPLDASDGFMGILAKFMQMLLGGNGLGDLFGNMGRSVSTGFGNFSDGLRGLGDTPLAPRGVKQNLGVGNTLGTTLRGGWDGVLDLIGKHESGGDYNRVYGSGVQRINLTNMTIDQVQEWQRNRVNQGYPSAAVGKYQIITKTLAGLEKQMGLTGKEKFDEAMQDRMAMQLLENRGIGKLQAGTMTTAQINRAINSISKEWASIEGANGRGAYDGDGLNKAAKGTKQAMAVALQAAVNGEEPSRSSVARKIDTTAVASNEAGYTKPPKAPSAAAEMTKVSAAGQPAINDPIAERKVVQVANGKVMFVGSYGEGSQIKQVASVTPDLRPTPGPGVSPKV
jgi:hypothetical protein